MDLSEIVRLVKTKLSAERPLEAAMNDFMALPSNYERVNYTDGLLERYGQYEEMERKCTIHMSKSNEIALALRMKGNEVFNANDYFRALELFNLSLCSSEPDTGHVAVGYANRSAVLFQMRCFQQCLDNVDMARKANLPEQLMQKLNERDKISYLLQDAQKENERKSLRDVKLSYKPHPKVPYIAECLEMKTSEKLGRYIYTKKSLMPGDLIAIEEPFCFTLKPFSSFLRCANCSEHNQLSLIPCSNCTNTMYCSEECMKIGGENFHKYECPVIDLFYRLFGKVSIAVRLTLMTITLFETIDECIDFFEDPANQNHCAFSLNYKEYSKKEYLKAMMGLVQNEEKRSGSRHFSHSIMVAIIRKYLLQESNLKAIIVEEKHKKFFSELIFRYVQSCYCNATEMIQTHLRNYQPDFNPYGMAIYAFRSLLSHSCAPNTFTVFQGCKSLIYVLRPIPANGIVNITYDLPFSLLEKPVRQLRLLEQYHFHCDCEACVKDYPLLENLKKQLYTRCIP